MKKVSQVNFYHRGNKTVILISLSGLSNIMETLTTNSSKIESVIRSYFYYIE